MGEGVQAALRAMVDEHRDLSPSEAGDAMRDLMTGEATGAQVGAFLIALRMKGETVDEIAAMARVMRSRALHVDIPDRPLLDTAGTGGSRKRFNASTAAAFVVAAAGGKVAKHGNRAMSSQSGAADFLEALGAEIALTPAQVAECVQRTGVGFMFAQAFHPAMKHVAPARREVGVRTVFNILGPLTNPAGANTHLMGAATPELAETLAHVLAQLDMRHALVVCDEDGLDDISVTGKTTAFEVKGAQVAETSIEPVTLGLTRYETGDVEGGTAEENAEIFRRVLAGEGPAANRDLVVANAAGGLYLLGLASNLRDGARMAREVIDSGDAAARVGAFVEVTRRLAREQGQR